MHSLSKDVKLESLSAHTEHWEPVLDVACFAALCPSQTFWVRRWSVWTPSGIDPQATTDTGNSSSSDNTHGKSQCKCSLRVVTVLTVHLYVISAHFNEQIHCILC